MTSTQSGSDILKTDRRGRVRTTPERRQEFLEEFDKSGLSAPKYAALTGLKYQTFAGWLIQRRKQQDEAAPAVQPSKQPTVQWLETVIEKGTGGSSPSKFQLNGAPAFRGDDRSGECCACGARRRSGAFLGEGVRVLSFTGGLKVFVALQPCDLRKSFNGLHGLVTEKLGEDPRTGALFVFVNQRRTRLKVLHKALLLFKSGRLHLPQSLLGQAVDYAFGQWSTLEVYLQDGSIEIDNNLVENAIRPTAVGKKNWLFIGEAGAGQRGGIIYTIIESCRRRKIDPFAYLRDLLTRLPHF